jgi:hypothetical protein
LPNRPQPLPIHEFPQTSDPSALGENKMAQDVLNTESLPDGSMMSMNIQTVALKLLSDVGEIFFPF